MSSTRTRSDWKARALARVHARQVVVQERQKYVDMGRVQMTVGAFYLRALANAAERRGLSVTVYCRRAIAAFVAADESMRFTDLVADTPHPQGQIGGSHDDGEGHGLWVASPFEDDMGRIQGS